MKKHTLKIMIDTLLFIDLSSIAALGLLMGFVIPSGQRGGGEKTFLGLHRHDWGDFHLTLSILLLALLVLHLFLNWAWIVQSAKTLFSDRWQQVLIGLSGAWIVILFLGWIVMVLG